MSQLESRLVAAAAVRLALSTDRETEKDLKKELNSAGIRATAVDYGGEYLAAVQKVIERAVVAAKREGVIASTHQEEGSVAEPPGKPLPKLCPKRWDLMLVVK